MLSVQRLREFTSTLRFRLALWITIVVFLTVAVKNIAVREVEHYLLRHSYDEFLKESVEEVNLLLNKPGLENAEPLQAALAEKVRGNESHSWFLQIYDQHGRLIFGSNNAPALPPPSFQGDTLGPYDHSKHRILESRLKRESGASYYIRCGFPQIELQDDIAIVNQNLLLASLSILIFAPIVGYIIALRATRPIAQIIAAASQMQPGNLSERLPIRGTGDEIDRLSQTINGLLDRLASFINQNRDFVANAAHELRSPLTAIRSSVEVGLNEFRSPEEYTLILADVLEEISHLAVLVNHLLILAEGDAGRLGGMDQITRLDKIVCESVEMFGAVAELKGVRLLAGEIESAAVAGDESNLRQAVRNLIDNAIKYTKSGGEVEVQLRVDPIKKQAVLIIRDTGVGIEQALVPRIFERFYRADKSRTRGQDRTGYGLGLSICATIIQALKGTITVESEVGVGSTFTIRLPLVAEPAALTQSSEKHLPLPAAS
jgi:signal transduction histidine kinase